MKKRGKMLQRGKRRTPRGRLLSMFLVLCMVLTMLPVSAMAEEAQTTIGASGEIIAFEPLAETEKTVTTGTSIKDLELPETLTATVRAAVISDSGASEETVQDSASPEEDTAVDDSATATADSAIEAEVSEPQEAGEATTPEWEETTVDIPVTWISQPEYDMDTEGEYVFTPVIGGYTVSAELPEIAVTVEAARMMMGMISPMAVTEYSIWVGGTRVTSDNMNDVLGDGTVRYTPASSSPYPTLTLNNARITGALTSQTVPQRKYGIYTEYSLKIVLEGSNTITTESGAYSYAICVNNGHLTISGTGSLNAAGGKATYNQGASYGVYLDQGNLIVESGSLTASGDVSKGFGSYGVVVQSGNAIVKGGSLKATGGQATDKSDGKSYGIWIIGNSNRLVVEGGAVSATSGTAKTDSYGIGASSISINGGTVTASAQGQAMKIAPTFGSSYIHKNTAGASPSSTGAVVVTDEILTTDIRSYKYVKIESPVVAKNTTTGTGYATLQKAVDEVAEKETIQLLDDITLTATVTIASGNSKSFTLDLNGHTLNGGYATAISHEGSGTLTITDTSGGEGGTVLSSSGWKGSTITLLNDSSLVVSGGTVKYTGDGLGAIYSTSTSSVSVTSGTVESTGQSNGIYSSSTGSVSVTGGTVKNTNSSSANADAISNNGTGMVSVSGGRVISGSGRAILNLDAGSVSVSGGTVSADASPAILEGGLGKITIGGTATVTSANSSATYPGTIYLDFGGSPALEITGGTIENTAAGGNAIYNIINRKISIPSGTPVIKGDGKAMNKAPDLSGYANVKVTASTFYNGASPVTYNAANIATYKYLKFEQGSANVAQIGSTGYETLQEAVNAVAEGQTIQLLDDITLTATVTIASGSNKSFTLDLKGKTLDGGANTAIKHEGTGTLTITDTKGGGKVTAKKDKYSCTIDLNGGSLVVVGGTLENTDVGSAIYNEGAGTVNIQGGTVRGYSYAIQNKSTGDVIVFDGVLEGQIAIYNSSGSGNVTISGGALSGMRGIYNFSTGEVSVSGGTVSASGDNSQAIQNVGGGNVNVSGGTLKASGDKSRAISNGSMVNVSISGGTVSATGTNSVGIDSATIYIPSGSPVIQGGGRAMNTAPDLSGYTKVKVTASTNYDGTPSVAYDSEKIGTYKYLTFTNDTDNTVTNLNLGGKLIAPETGGTPMTTITDDDQYTGTVEWDGSPTKFLADTVYSATVTLTAKPGYTFSGVAQRAFTCTGATYVMNPAGDGDMLNVTITFPKTAASALQSIAITTPPNTTAYKFGDAFSIAGMVVKATYNDGTEDANFTAYTVDKTGALTMGDTTITLTANGTSITTTQAITVTKADGPAAPTGLAGVAPTSAGGTDGKITGTSTAMEYAKNLGFTGAADCTATETTGLSAGTYYVRVKATATHEASASATVTVPAGVTKIAVPTANTGLKWTGTEQIGVNSGTGYTLSGTDKATDVGDYIATATLQSGYAWNDNTNTDKTISWSIAKADGPAVTGVSAVNCTTVSNNDGKLTGVTTAMEYKKSDAASYIPGTGSDITGLTNGTYLVRVKATATHNEGADSSFTVGAYVPGALTGTATISNVAPRIDNVLNGSLDDSNNTGTLTYVWKADGTQVGTGASYMVNMADHGKTITLEIQSTIETGTVTSTATAAVLKKAAPSAPGAPTLASKTHNTVTLTANAAYQFSKDGTTWQTGNVFSGLTASTAYTFYQRVAETADTEASTPSTGFSVTTDTAPADALTGTATISGTLKYGQTLTVAYSSGNNTGNLSYQWKRGNINIGTNSNTYTIVEADINQTLTCEVTSDVQTGSVSGSITATISKADGYAVTGVSAVNCTTVSNNDGKLTGVTTAMEYKKSDAASYIPGTGSDITGLTNGTYLVRVKATATHNEGADSSFTVGAYVPGALTGTATISNVAPRIDNVLNGSLDDSNNTGTLTYVWKADGTQVGTGASYMVNMADHGKTITLEIQSTIETGTVTSTATAAVLKKAAPSAPGAPTLASKTHNTVTLTANAAYQFSKDGTTWQTGNVFSGLTASTAYTFYQRVAETADTEASTASTGFNVTTNPKGGSGGSGGGGGSADNNSSPVLVTLPAPDKPNSPTQGEIKVPGTMDSKGNVTVNITDKTVTDAFDKALADAKKNGNEQNGITVVLRVDTGSKTGSHVTVNLPKTVQDTILAKKIVNILVVVANPDIRIGMDLATVQEINQQAKSDVNITATRTDSGRLTGEAKKAIGSRPVFDLTVNYGSGKQVQSFGAGSVSVTIPYTLGANEKAGNVQAVYVDGNGKVHWLTSSVYDSVNKVLRFSTNHFSTYGIGYKQTNTIFTDIASHWAKEDIEFVVSRGLFSGTSTTTFSPNTAMTRGMFVTALGRLAKADVSSYKQSSFTDVKSDAYYMSYIEWASKNNIVNGTGNGKFAPDQSITREQMAVIMQNCTKVIGFTLPTVHGENTFADSAKISAYTKDAVKQMQMAGVISGKNGNLFDPQGTATRAEASAVLRRFVELGDLQ
ncbi:S-layer homology domain-containing protein [Desulfotomaculum sp. 1211_IL3151]|uniref:S-layer homology domain-containing protein n=1 Tax=Desulfotomaculum sp. 1211_IL3151 TaxID=3084055 RepID=UPI002FD89D25